MLYQFIFIVPLLAVYTHASAIPNSVTEDPENNQEYLRMNDFLLAQLSKNMHPFDT